MGGSGEGNLAVRFREKEMKLMRKGGDDGGLKEEKSLVENRIYEFRIRY